MSGHSASGLCEEVVEVVFELGDDDQKHDESKTGVNANAHTIVRRRSGRVGWFTGRDAMAPGGHALEPAYWRPKIALASAAGASGDGAATSWTSRRTRVPSKANGAS